MSKRNNRKFQNFSKLAHTFSIVARDPESGEMGVAVQSHWFSVGSVVTWAEAGVVAGDQRAHELRQAAVAYLPFSPCLGYNPYTSSQGITNEG
jgi:hypothetical protein